MGNIEKNIKELERISAMLDKTQTTVDESLEYYAKSIEIAKSCLGEISLAKGKFEELNAELKKLEL